MATLSDIRSNLKGYAAQGHELLATVNGATFAFGALLLKAQADIGSNPKYKGTMIDWAKGEFPDVSQSALYLARDAAEVAEVLGDCRGGSVSGIAKLARVLKLAGNGEGERETAEQMARDIFSRACEGLKANGRVSAAAIQSALDSEGIEGTRGPAAGTPRTDGDEPTDGDETTDEPTETPATETPASDEPSDRNTPTAGETDPETDAAALIAANGTLERILTDMDADAISAILPTILATVTACETHGVSVMYSTVKSYTNKHKAQVRRAANAAKRAA